MFKSREMRLAGHVERMGENRNVYWDFVGKPEGKRPLGRPRRMCVHYIKVDPREIEWGGIDWIDQAQERDQWRTQHDIESSGSIKC
jgi:hypothetical protein